MGSPFTKWLAKALSGDSRDPSDFFLPRFGLFLADPTWSEAKFRNELQAHLTELGGDVELKREAGISGTGTRIDLYAHAEGRDYLITIKKGLSQQKIKTVLGEIRIMLDNWKPRVPGNTTHIVFVVFGCKTKGELEHLADFMRFAGEVPDGFRIHVEPPCQSEEELKEALAGLEKRFKG